MKNHLGCILLQLMFTHFLLGPCPVFAASNQPCDLNIDGVCDDKDSFFATQLQNGECDYNGDGRCDAKDDKMLKNLSQHAAQHGYPVDNNGNPNDFFNKQGQLSPGGGKQGAAQALLQILPSLLGGIASGGLGGGLGGGGLGGGLGGGGNGFGGGGNFSGGGTSPNMQQAQMLANRNFSSNKEGSSTNPPRVQTSPTPSPTPQVQQQPACNV